MKRKLPSITFWRGHGFMARFGPTLADWEHAPFPDDSGIDEYEVGKLRRRLKL